MNYYIEIHSPIGPLHITCNEAGITELHMGSKAPAPGAKRGHTLLDRAVEQLTDYFAGKRAEFDLPLSPRGTDFQRKVWQRLREIPFAHTSSYGEVAARVGNPKASRAVGAANGRNPIAVIVPCHRVIGADGSLTGFGGGLERKQWLLEHERAHAKS
ncbi:MAG: methylated-DNA--[protein]-cysteine S-methyltransferase [Planctomycetes bacterium]|nr:methylated-DNA--[protein]-cysteine S-methyltransferase [Planctomycetota bacterium]